MEAVSETYRDRAIDFMGLREVRGWRLKLYSVRYTPEPLPEEVYEEGLLQAVEALPSPATAADRPGVAFVIFHCGRGVDFLVVNWWDHENELFNRVLLRSFGEAAAWEWGRGGETACVWDLQILCFERDAYVRRVLAPPHGPDLEGYLDETLSVPAG